jgi:hypothetical protein
MKRYIIAAAVGAVLAIAPGRELAAQPWEAGLPGEDVVSLALKLGAVSPMTTLEDGTEFSGGLAGGASFTYWAIPNMGVRLNFQRGKTEGNAASRAEQGLPTAAASQENPTVTFAGAELNFRYPVGAGSMVISPYAGGGAGGKEYHWSEAITGVERDLVFVWNLTGGLDIRPVSAPWLGVVLEAQRFTSKYKWHAMFWDEPKFNDMVYTVGISLNH